MTTSPHTPDPAQGALIDAAGVVFEPNDDEVVRAAIARLGDEQILDWVAYIRSHTELNSDVAYIQRSAPSPAVASEWFINTDGFHENSTVGAKMWQWITAPTGLRLYEVSVWFRPASETRVGMPGAMPSARLLRHANTTSVAVVAGPASDTWSDEVTYETAHPITLTVNDNVGGPPEVYKLEFTTESGSDSFDGTRYIYTIATFIPIP